MPEPAAPVSSFGKALADFNTGGTVAGLLQPVPDNAPFGAFRNAMAEGLQDNPNIDPSLRYQAALQSHAREGRSVEDVVPKLAQQFGVPEKEARSAYSLRREHAYFADKEPSTTELWNLRSVPYVSGIGVNQIAAQYKEARDRIAAGNPREGDPNVKPRWNFLPDPGESDYRKVARYERLQATEAKQRSTLEGDVTASLAHMPAMLLEAYSGGKAATLVGRIPAVARFASKFPKVGRALGLAEESAVAEEGAPSIKSIVGLQNIATKEGAKTYAKETALDAVATAVRTPGQTAAMPSMYLPQSAERAIEKGGDWSDVDNLGRSYAIANLQVAVLGRLGPAGDAIPAGGPVAFGTRLGVRTGTGMVEQQAVDSIAQAVGLQEKKGTLYDAVNSEPGSLKNATTEAITFAAFSLMHGAPQKKGLKPKPLEIDPAKAQQAVAPVVETIDALKAQGQTPQQIGDTMQGVHQKIDAALVADPTLTKDQARKLFENEPPEIQKYAEVKIGTLPDKKVPIQDSSLAPREAVLKEMGRQKGNEAILNLAMEMSPEEGASRESALRAVARMREGNLKRLAEQMIEQVYGPDPAKAAEPAKAPVEPVKPSSEWTDPSAVVEPSDHTQAFDKLSPAVQGELAQTHGVPVEAFRSGADPAYRQTLRKHLEQTARPAVLKDTFKKIGAKGEFESLPNGDEIGVFPHGDRYVQVYHSPKDNYARIDFDYLDPTGGVRTGDTKGPLQAGTKGLADKIKGMIEEFHKKGTMIAYSASEAQAGRGGSRTGIYEKYLERAGYKLTSVTDNPAGAKDYLWEPTAKPGKKAPYQPEIAPAAPKPADLPPQESATPPKPEPASVVPEQKPVVPANDVPSKANTSAQRVDGKENVPLTAKEQDAADHAAAVARLGGAEPFTAKAADHVAQLFKEGKVTAKEAADTLAAMSGRTFEEIGGERGVTKQAVDDAFARTFGKLELDRDDLNGAIDDAAVANKAHVVDKYGDGKVTTKEVSWTAEDKAADKTAYGQQLAADHEEAYLTDLIARLENNKLKPKERDAILAKLNAELARLDAKLTEFENAQRARRSGNASGKSPPAPAGPSAAQGRKAEAKPSAKAAGVEAPAPAVADRRSEPFRTPKDQFPTPDPRLKEIAKRAGDEGRLRTRASWHGQQPELEFLDKSGKYKILLTTKPDGFVDLDFNKVDAVGGRDQAKSLGAPATKEGVSVVREVRELARELHGKGVPLEYATSDTINAAKAGEASRHDWYSKFLPRVGYREATPPGGIDMGDGVRVFRWEPAEKSGFLSDQVQGNLFGRGTRAPLPAKKGGMASMFAGEPEAKANVEEAEKAHVEWQRKLGNVPKEGESHADWVTRTLERDPDEMDFDFHQRQAAVNNKAQVVEDQIRLAKEEVAKLEGELKNRRPGQSLIDAVIAAGGIRADSLGRSVGGKTKADLVKENPGLWDLKGLIWGKPVKKGVKQKGADLADLAGHLADAGHIPGGAQKGADARRAESGSIAEGEKENAADSLVRMLGSGHESLLGDTTAHVEKLQQLEAARSFLEAMHDPAKYRDAVIGADDSFDFGHNQMFSGLPIRLTFLDDMKGFSYKAMAKRWFASAGNLPLEAFEAKLRKDGRFGSYAEDVKNMEKDLRTAVKDYKKGGGYDSLDDAEVKMMNLALENNVMAKLQVRQMDPAIADRIEQMRSYIDGMSDALIANGAAKGQMVATIDQNKGMYLNRAYRVFSEPDWYRKVDQGTKNYFMSWLDAEQKKLGVTLTQPQLEAYTEKLLRNETAYENPLAFIYSRKLGEKDLGIFTKRGDVPEPLRALWGEVKDPIANLTNTVQKQAHMLVNHAFQQEVVNAGKGKFFFDEPTINADGEHVHTLLDPDPTGTNSMGDLAGKHMTLELKKAFEELYKPVEMGKLERAYMKAMAITKYSKTVLSPTSQVRNVLGNLFKIISNGHYRVQAAMPAVKVFLSDSAASRAKYRRLVELGVIGDGVHEGDFRKAVAEVFEGKDKLLANRLGEVTDRQIARNLKRGLKVLTNLYRMGDAVPKVYAYMNELASYERAFPNMPKPQLEEMAAKNVRLTFPTHSMAPRIVSAARRNPFGGPFPTFTAETIRSNVATLKLAFQEMKNPATRSIGARRFAGFVAAAGLTASLGAVSRAITGTTSDEEEAMRRNMPSWGSNSTILHLGRSKDGKPIYIDTGSTDPNAYFAKIVNAAMRGQWKEAGFEAAGPFGYDEEILTSKLMDVARNKEMRSGKEVYNPQAPGADQAEKVGRHVGEAFKPGAVDTVQRINKSEHPEREFTQLAGQRVQEIDAQKNMLFKAKDFIHNRSEAHNLVNSVIKSREPVDDAKVTAEYKKTEDSRRKLFDEMRKDYLAARLLRIDEGEIAKAMKDGGVSQDDIRRIKNGEYKPYSPEVDSKDSPEVRRRKEVVRLLAR